MSQRCPKHDSLTHCFPFANANVESTTIRIIVQQLLNFKDAECNRPLLKKTATTFTPTFSTPKWSRLAFQVLVILESVNSSWNLWIHLAFQTQISQTSLGHLLLCKFLSLLQDLFLPRFGVASTFFYQVGKQRVQKFYDPNQQIEWLKGWN